MEQMTFEQFLTTGHDTDDIGEELGDSSLAGIPGRIYDNAFYIQRRSDGSFYLPLEKDEFESRDLSELEARLYHYARDSGEF